MNFDIDVPLFLGALYGDRRIHDMRLLKQRESLHPASGFAGTVNFCSGWEWGYWVGDVMASRGAWSVLGVNGASSTQEQALRQALLPIAGVFDAATGGDGCQPSSCARGGMGERVMDLLVDVVSTQRRTLIAGRFANGTQGGPGDGGDVVQRNGQGLIEGWDAMIEIEAAITHVRLIETVEMKIL